jgi:hypothetical protein
VKRFAPVIAAVALLAVGCGEAGLLDGVGDRTRTYMQGETTTTISIPTVAAGTGDEALVGALDVVWYNDAKDPQHVGESGDVVAGVWEDRVGNSRFVQSSRAELAAALPSLRFPEFVPDQVRWITSQLVYRESTGQLDPDTSAAFGLWTSDPYQSDTGRIGVLRVGKAAVDTQDQRSDIDLVVVPDGISLGWSESSLRYELFCRSEISEQLCTDVATSVLPMSELLSTA